MKTLSLSLRKLKKSKAATLFGIAGLVTGLICVLYIFFWVNDETSYDQFHKKINRIFVVHAYLQGGTKEVKFNGCPPAVGPALKAEYPEVENSCRYIPTYFKSLLTADGRKEMTGVAFSDNSLFDIFSLPFIYGTKGNPEVVNQIVLTRTTATNYFGNSNPVGKIVRYNNQKDMTVVGVIEDIPQNSSIQFDAVIPLENLRMFYDRDDFLTTWYNNGFTTFGLLTSPSGFDKIATTITRRIQKEMPESTNYLRAYLFKNGYLYEQQHIRNVRIFSLIAILVLLAAVLNFINLITAKSTKQAKETGLRKSIGATRGNIIKLVYSEVAFLCFLALALALIIAVLGLPIFNQLIGKQISFSSLLTLKPLAILVLAYLVTTFLAGSYPAFFLSSFKITETLNSSFYSVKSRGIFRNSLLVTIFMVSIILLASTLIISKQTMFLQNMDVGFNKDQLLYVSLDGKLKEKAKALKEEAERTSGVYSSTIASFLPVTIGNNGEGWNWEGKDPEFKPLVTNWETDEDMIKTLGAKLIEGSYFSSDQKGIVINKAFADAIGWNSFTGKILKGYGTDYKVVGVIDNIEYNSLSETCRPMAIQPIQSWSSNYLILKIDASQMDKTIKSITGICQAIEPDYPVNYGFVDDQYAKLYESETSLKKLVGVFSIFSMVVLCLGLLGVVMFLAEQKTKEIGVRKCLGEDEKSIIIRLVKPFVFAGMFAAMIAIPATWYIMNLWLLSYANRIQLNIWTFVLALLIAITIAVVTVMWQSWKAATRNPVEALRYE
ncbi:ABC transporter, permease protein [Aquipluma nitroreducens]|uniref:ABC transporter, permease protein n=1 Tax=Aquipluma nitroreducens TaxID=2010828 RepID=A0A5K7S9Z0_9BACT|nr:ABC transporter permease [Aquipluma nitroreducens]BBE18403.1 ABC transporter, permease protein [Aquipluma nitroreducens]